MRKRAGRLSNTAGRKTGNRWKRGELLVETIVAIAVFVVVMVAVSAMVTVSYHMLNASREQYGQIRQRCSDIETMQDVGGYESSVLEFRFDDQNDSQTNAAIRVYGEGPVTFFTLGK